VADSAVIQAIRRYAQKYGADPVALLATSLQENSGRMRGFGDQGTSAGPFMFHRGGALGSHSFEWAQSPAAIENRASEFARLGIHGGTGAAALQRPADPVGYAAAVDKWKAQARQLLAQYGGGSSAPPPATVSASGSRGAPPSASLTGGVGVSGPTQRSQFLQSIIDQNSALAGIPTLTVPLPPVSTVAPTTRPAAPTPRSSMQPQTKALRSGYDAPIPSRKVIGTPYAGTHTLGNWESDNAIDLAAPIGSPIYATQSGTIGSQFGSLGEGGRFAGLRLHLKTPGNEFYYAHLSSFAPGIKPGVRVKAGQLLGYSGEANGVAHLHIGARSGNPLQLFGLRGRA
jgi:murein DD-endopeptidase MepM/ murein hydrolase activator NlpD